jgi:hypothetical protein
LRDIGSGRLASRADEAHGDAIAGRNRTQSGPRQYKRACSGPQGQDASVL